jgi:CheY-like chemotaxis protein
MTFINRGILYIDDDEAARLTMTLLFGQHGYEVLAVSSAQATLFFLSEESFDLYILGPRLSRMGPIAFCREIRKSERYAPIIIYSEGMGEAVKDAEVCVGCSVFSARLGLDKLLSKVRAELEL